MAAKKTTEKTDINQLKDIVGEETDAEMINKLPDDLPEDPWSKNMEIIVPRKPKGEEQTYYICVNDRRFLVPANGKAQNLPKPVAQILLDSIQAQDAADDFAESIPNHTGPQEMPL